MRKTGVVFLDTLFDENAACHIAWGAGHPVALEGGEEMTSDELAARGYNDSIVHTDFMIGGPEVDRDRRRSGRRRGADHRGRRVGARVTPVAKPRLR